MFILLQVYILKDYFVVNLKLIVYMFKGYEGFSWLLDMEVFWVVMELDFVGV